jgi:hypothetical protein
MTMPSKAWRAVLVMVGMGTLTLALQVTTTVLQVGYQPTLDALRSAKFCKRSAPEQSQQQAIASKPAVDNLVIEIIEDSK